MTDDGTTTPPSPNAVPTATEAYGLGWTVLTRHPIELLLIGIVWAVLTSPSGYLHDGALGLIYQLLVVGPVGFGGAYAYLRAARGEKPEVADVFAPFRANYAQVVLASLLLSVIIGIGFMLLIIPGIIAVVRLGWVPYLVVERGRSATDAVRESWEMTAPYGWTILIIDLLALPLVLVGLLFFVVGVIPALILVHLTAGSFYAAVVPAPAGAGAPTGMPDPGPIG